MGNWIPTFRRNIIPPPSMRFFSELYIISDKGTAFLCYDGNRFHHAAVSYPWRKESSLHRHYVSCLRCPCTAMKVYRSSGGVVINILKLGTRRWVVSLTLLLLYSQGKRPRYPLQRKLCGPRNPVLLSEVILGVWSLIPSKYRIEILYKIIRIFFSHRKIYSQLCSSCVRGTVRKLSTSTKGYDATCM